MDQRVTERGFWWALANSCLRNALLLIWICAVSGLNFKPVDLGHSESADGFVDVKHTYIDIHMS